MSQLMLKDWRADPDRLQVSYDRTEVTVSLAGITWVGTDETLDQLLRALTFLRAEAQTKRDVLQAMLPTKGEK